MKRKYDILLGKELEVKCESSAFINFSFILFLFFQMLKFFSPFVFHSHSHTHTHTFSHSLSCSYYDIPSQDDSGHGEHAMAESHPCWRYRPVVSLCTTIVRARVSRFFYMICFIYLVSSLSRIVCDDIFLPSLVHISSFFPRWNARPALQASYSLWRARRGRGIAGAAAQQRAWPVAKGCGQTTAGAGSGAWSCLYYPSEHGQGLFKLDLIININCSHTFASSGE